MGSIGRNNECVPVRLSGLSLAVAMQAIRLSYWTVCKGGAKLKSEAQMHALSHENLQPRRQSCFRHNVTTWHSGIRQVIPVCTNQADRAARLIRVGTLVAHTVRI